MKNETHWERSHRLLNTPKQTTAIACPKKWSAEVERRIKKAGVR
jgi:hypothetical protein